MKIKNILLVLFSVVILFSCSSQKNLAYLGNLSESGGEETFPMDIPDYKIQPRDILYITIKAMTPDGFITDFLSSARGSSVSLLQGEAGGYLFGYDVTQDGHIVLPAIGRAKVAGLTLDETRTLLQELSKSVFRNATVECKLLSFKFTVIGEVKAPGAYNNYNNYLTVLEAIGRAGGIGDFGDRARVLVVRPADEGTITYSISLQDKKLLTSEAYFLLPNDVVIVQPLGHKIFNLNLPTFGFILSSVTSTITMTLLLINFFGK